MQRELKLFCVRDTLKATLDEQRSESAFVICHGFGGNKDEPEEVALSQEIVDRGFTTIRVSHKTGKRHDLLFEEQAMQLVDCVTILFGYTNVKRVHLIGTSMGGSNALTAGLRDKRINSICSIAAISDGSRWMKERHGTRSFESFMSQLEQAELHRLETGEEVLFPIRDALNVHTRFFEPPEQISDASSAITHISTATLRSLVRYRPINVLKASADKPIMFSHGLSDSLVSAEHTNQMLRVYKGRKKKLMIADGEHDMISISEIRRRVLTAYFDWLEQIGLL